MIKFLFFTILLVLNLTTSQAENDFNECEILKTNYFKYLAKKEELDKLKKEYDEKFNANHILREAVKIGDEGFAKDLMLAAESLQKDIKDNNTEQNTEYGMLAASTGALIISSRYLFNRYKELKASGTPHSTKIRAQTKHFFDKGKLKVRFLSFAAAATFAGSLYFDYQIGKKVLERNDVEEQLSVTIDTLNDLALEYEEKIRAQQKQLDPLLVKVKYQEKLLIEEGKKINLSEKDFFCY